MPTTEQLAEMGNYNEELAKAGVMIDGNGLHPTSKGERVRFADGDASVIDGPFSESKELIAGYWIWECDSLDDAVGVDQEGTVPRGHPDRDPPDLQRRRFRRCLDA